MSAPYLGTSPGARCSGATTSRSCGASAAGASTSSTSIRPSGPAGAGGWSRSGPGAGQDATRLRWPPLIATTSCPPTSTTTGWCSTTTSPSSSRGSWRLHRVLAPHGCLYVHLDYREVHYAKVLLDEIFGRELLPQRDHLGLRLRRPAARSLAAQARQHPLVREATRMATSSTATRSTGSPTWRRASSGPEKAARGKLPTDTWWHTIVPADGKEKHGLPDAEAAGHPASASSRRRAAPGDLVLDFFARQRHDGRRRPAAGRRYLLVDSSPDAVRITQERLCREARAIEGESPAVS